MRLISSQRELAASLLGVIVIVGFIATRTGHQPPTAGTASGSNSLVNEGADDHPVSNHGWSYPWNPSSLLQIFDESKDEDYGGDEELDEIDFRPEASHQANLDSDARALLHPMEKPKEPAKISHISSKMPSTLKLLGEKVQHTEPQAPKQTEPTEISPLLPYKVQKAMKHSETYVNGIAERIKVKKQAAEAKEEAEEAEEGSAPPSTLSLLGTKMATGGGPVQKDKEDRTRHSTHFDSMDDALAALQEKMENKMLAEEAVKEKAIRTKARQATAVSKDELIELDAPKKHDGLKIRKKLKKKLKSPVDTLVRHLNHIEGKLRVSNLGSHDLPREVRLLNKLAAQWLLSIPETLEVQRLPSLVHGLYRAASGGMTKTAVMNLVGKSQEAGEDSRRIVERVTEGNARNAAMLVVLQSAGKQTTAKTISDASDAMTAVMETAMGKAGQNHITASSRHKIERRLHRQLKQLVQLKYALHREVEHAGKKALGRFCKLQWFQTLFQTDESDITQNAVCWSDDL